MSAAPDDLADSRLAEQVALGVEALNQLGIPNTLADVIEALQRQLSEARAEHFNLIEQVREHCGIGLVDFIDGFDFGAALERHNAEFDKVDSELFETRRQLSDSRAAEERMREAAVRVAEEHAARYRERIGVSSKPGVRARQAAACESIAAEILRLPRLSPPPCS